MLIHCLICLLFNLFSRQGGRNAIHAELGRQLFPPRKAQGSQKSLDRQKSLLDRQKSPEVSGDLKKQGSAVRKSRPVPEAFHPAPFNLLTLEGYLNPKTILNPETILNPKTYTLNPKPLTLHTTPYALHPEP